MTSVSHVDGTYVGWGIDADDETYTVYHVAITNTTKDEAGKIWITITDSDMVYGNVLLDAIRFEAQCDADGNITATNVAATEPMTCYNIYYGQGYYTYAGYFDDYSNYEVSVSGKVTKDGVDTATGHKTDGIKLHVTRKYDDGYVEEYDIDGMRVTGWPEDTAEFEAFIDEM